MEKNVEFGAEGRGTLFTICHQFMCIHMRVSGSLQLEFLHNF